MESSLSKYFKTNFEEDNFYSNPESSKGYSFENEEEVLNKEIELIELPLEDYNILDVIYTTSNRMIIRISNFSLSEKILKFFYKKSTELEVSIKNLQKTWHYENFIHDLLKKKDLENRYFTQKVSAQIIENQFVKGYIIGIEEANCSLDKILKLRFHRKNKEKIYYDEKELCLILKHLIQGFVILEQNGIAHCDVKPENIFVYKKEGSYIYKIGDFGVSIYLKDRKELNIESIRGWTQDYVAPEFLEKAKKVNPFLMDVFSLGLTFLEMIGIKCCEARKMILQDENLKFDKFLEEKYPLILPIIRKMVRKQPFNRICFENLNEELYKFSSIDIDSKNEGKIIKEYEYKIGKSFIPGDTREQYAQRNVFQNTLIQKKVVSKIRYKTICEMNNLFWEAVTLYNQGKYSQAVEYILTIFSWYEAEFGRKPRVYKLINVILAFLYHISQEFDKFVQILPEAFHNKEQLHQLIGGIVPSHEFEEISNRLAFHKEKLIYDLNSVFHNVGEFFIKYFDPKFIKPNVVNIIFGMENLLIEDPFYVYFYYDMCKESIFFMETLDNPYYLMLAVSQSKYFEHISFFFLHCSKDEINSILYLQLLEKIECNKEYIDNYYLVHGQIFLILANNLKSKENELFKVYLLKGYNLSMLSFEKTKNYDFQKTFESYSKILKNIQQNLNLLLSKKINNKKDIYEKLYEAINFILNLINIKYYPFDIQSKIYFFQNAIESLFQNAGNLIRILFPELYFSFKEIRNYYSLNNNRKKVILLLEKEIKLKKIILGDKNIELFPLIWEYGSYKLALSNDIALKQISKKYEIEEKDLIDEETIWQIIEISKNYLLSNKLLTKLRILQIFKNLYALMVNIKIRIDFWSNDVWQTIKENMKQLLLIIAKFPQESLTPDIDFLKAYKDKILEFNFVAWSDVKIFKELQKKINYF